MKKYFLLGLLAFGWLSVSVSGLAAQHPVPAVQDTETKEQRDARMAWWREARFGMFIHWGLYAIPAGEWNGKYYGGNGEWLMADAKIPVADYQRLAARFNPVKFSADEWVALAKAAGMKYIVITTKHHDGFAMFKSAHPFNIVDATPFKRDPLQELAAAAQRQGIPLGFYYSQGHDWTAIGGGNTRPKWDAAQEGDFAAYIRDKAVPQLRELFANYQPAPAVVWFDFGVGEEFMPAARAAEIVSVLNEHQRLIWNDRLGGGYTGDTITPEQYIPPTGYASRDWEVCMTMNDTWGYTKNLDYKNVEQLLRNLIDIVSKGGNYLLNIGPDADGVIPPQQVERLQAVGKWLADNGEAIYGTTASPFPRQLTWGRVTKKSGKLFLHVFDFPAAGKLLLPADAQVVKAYPLARPGQPLTVTQTPDGLEIQVSDLTPDPLATVLVLEHNGDVVPLTMPVEPDAKGTLTLSVIDAILEGKQLRLENNPPNLGHWTELGDYVRWSARLKQSGAFNVSMEYALDTGGAALTLTVGGQTLSLKPAATGSWEKYQTAELGAVTVSAGDCEIKLTASAQAKSGGIINLRKITLTPAP